LASLDLNLLVVLDTVLTERSVARAARRLHVTPSAISNALARLRAALDDPLVVRSGRGIVPTPRALALAPRLARVLREIDEAVHGAAFEPSTTDREFTLALADAGQIVWLPRLAAALTRHMPRARLRVVGIDMLIAAGGLAGSAVDVAIALEDKSPGVHARPLYDERLVLVARRDHPRARGKLGKTTLAALRHVDVHIAPGRGSRDVAAAYARRGLPRDVALAVPTFTAAAAVVAETDLVTTLPSRLLDVLANRLALRALAPPIAPITVQMRLLWHERTHHDPASVAFRDLLVHVSGSRGRTRPRG
jgi:DNA-binding transcriptional LysR family regulator